MRRRLSLKLIQDSGYLKISNLIDDLFYNYGNSLSANFTEDAKKL